MIYQDPTMPTHRRVADLLQQMNLEEKLAQLEAVPALDLLQAGSYDRSKLASLLEHGAGWITMLSGNTNLTRQETAELANQIQEHLIKQTRLGIPAILQEQSLAGFMASDATTFPESLGLAASWRPGSVRQIASVIASQMRDVGVHATLAPVLDLTRDPRVGRPEETFGEDVHLTATLGLAMLEGLQQGNGTEAVLAAAKYFGEESQLDPFEQLVRHGDLAAIVHADAKSENVPCAANRQLLTELLRDMWGFSGVVLSDNGGIDALYKPQGFVESLPEAAALAIESGVDVDVSAKRSFARPLFEAVDRAQVDESVVDRAVGRVLTQKFELGLFEEVFVRPPTNDRYYLNAKTLAAEAASEALVLLKNEADLLPLEPGLHLGIIGPNADDPRAMVGSNAHVARQELLAYWRDNPQSDLIGVPKDLPLNFDISHLDGLTDELAKNAKSVRYAQGVAIDSQDRSQIAAAVAVANESDVAIVVLGERSGLTPSHHGGGEGYRTTIDLPDVQQELLQAVVATGTPTVLILLNGSPLSVAWANENVPSILWAVLPGPMGAMVIAETLFGQREPRGRLPVTVARHVDQLPLHYSDKPPGDDGQWWNSEGPQEQRALWAFGHGLGYTTFEMPRVSNPGSALTGDQELLLVAAVENTGKRAGETIVQVYAEHPSGDALIPAQRLVWFGAIALEPGQSMDMTIRIPVGRLATPNHKMARVLSAGSIQLGIGFSADAVKHRVKVEVIGTERTVTVPPIAH